MVGNVGLEMGVWGQKWGVWGWEWGLLCERWGRGLGFGLRTPRFGVGIFGVCGFCVPGSWVFWGHFGGRDPKGFGVADPPPPPAAWCPPPPEVQLKPRQQPFRLRRQWAELVLRLSDAPPGAVARGKAGGHGGGGGGGQGDGGGPGLGVAPHGVRSVAGGQTSMLGNFSVGLGEGADAVPPPLPPTQMSRACSCAATSSFLSTRSWR